MPRQTAELGGLPGEQKAAGAGADGVGGQDIRKGSNQRSGQTGK